MRYESSTRLVGQVLATWHVSIYRRVDVRDLFQHGRTIAKLQMAVSIETNQCILIEQVGTLIGKVVVVA